MIRVIFISCNFYQTNTWKCPLRVKCSLAKTALKLVMRSFWVKSKTRLGAVLKLLGHTHVYNIILDCLFWMFTWMFLLVYFRRGRDHYLISIKIISLVEYLLGVGEIRQEFENHHVLQSFCLGDKGCVYNQVRWYNGKRNGAHFVLILAHFQIAHNTNNGFINTTQVWVKLDFNDKYLLDPLSISEEGACHARLPLWKY